MLNVTSKELKSYCLNHHVAIKTLDIVDMSPMARTHMDNLYVVVNLRDPRAVVAANMQEGTLYEEDIKDFSASMCANYRTIVATSRLLVY